MARFKINRNNNKEEKQLLQAKLDASLVEEVNLLCQWSGNEKNYVLAELLLFSLSQETDFQQYQKKLVKQPPSTSVLTVSEPIQKDIGTEHKAPRSFRDAPQSTSRGSEALSEGCEGTRWKSVQLVKRCTSGHIHPRRTSALTTTSSGPNEPSGIGRF